MHDASTMTQSILYGAAGRVGEEPAEAEQEGLHPCIDSSITALQQYTSLLTLLHSLVQRPLTLYTVLKDTCT